MTFTFTGSKDVVDALCKCSNDKILGRPEIIVEKVNHYSGYSTCEIKCTGELADLIWLGWYAQFLQPSPAKSLMA